MLFLIIYILAPIAMLTIFRAKSPKHSWLALVICPVIDVLFFYREFTYYESRPIGIFFTIVQVIAVAIVVLIIRKRTYKQDKK